MKNINNRYVDFICGELPKEILISLDRPEDLKGERPTIGKFNVGPAIRVEVLVKTSYTRSANLLLKFNNIETEFIFYIPLSKSPDYILNGLRSKVEKKVNQIITQEDGGDWVKERYKKWDDDRNLMYKKIGEVINNSKIEKLNE
jgi:hypothetical protein